MSLPTLEEFLGKGKLGNSFIKRSGWRSLYMRKGPRHILGQTYYAVIDLASGEVTERRRGKGLFTELVGRIRELYPESPIFVENVLNKRLVVKLPKLGFESVTDSDPPCFILWPQTSLAGGDKSCGGDSHG